MILEYAIPALAIGVVCGWIICRAWRQDNFINVVTEDEMVRELVKRKSARRIEEVVKNELTREIVEKIDAEHPSDVSKATDAEKPAVSSWFNDNSPTGPAKPGWVQEWARNEDRASSSPDHQTDIPTKRT